VIIALAQKRSNTSPKRPLAPWSESASELYRPSKLVPTFADRGVPRGQHDGFLWPYSRIFRLELLLCLSSSSSVILARLSGPPFQTYYFSENLVVPGIEP
jgi:hypothetical protein